MRLAKLEDRAAIFRNHLVMRSKLRPKKRENGKWGLENCTSNLEEKCWQMMSFLTRYCTVAHQKRQTRDSEFRWLAWLIIRVSGQFRLLTLKFLIDNRPLVLCKAAITIFRGSIRRFTKICKKWAMCLICATIDTKQAAISNRCAEFPFPALSRFTSTSKGKRKMRKKTARRNIWSTSSTFTSKNLTIRKTQAITPTITYWEPVRYSPMILIRQIATWTSGQEIVFCAPNSYTQTKKCWERIPKSFRG